MSGSQISVAHLYNLRQRPGYQRHRQLWTKTKPVNIPIGTRRAPAPHNQPGFLRVDSVHQGDRDGLKGIYHINAVDCVTQFEVALLPEIKDEKASTTNSGKMTTDRDQSQPIKISGLKPQNHLRSDAYLDWKLLLQPLL
jgi:hypothetical protein